MKSSLYQFCVCDRNPCLSQIVNFIRINLQVDLKAETTLTYIKYYYNYSSNKGN